MKNTTLAKEVCNRSVTYLVDRNSGENYCTNTPCFYQNPTLSIFLQKQTKKKSSRHINFQIICNIFWSNHFKSSAKQKFLFTELVSVLDRNARIDYRVPSQLIGHSSIKNFLNFGSIVELAITQYGYPGIIAPVCNSLKFRGHDLGIFVPDSELLAADQKCL